MIFAFLSRYALPVLAGALLVAIGAASIQTARVGMYKVKASAADAEVTRLVEAAAGSEETITALSASLLALRKEAKAQGEAMKTAARALEEQEARISKQAAALAAAEAKDYEKPDCQALLETDLAAICPAHADSVRKRAARGLPGPAR